MKEETFDVIVAGGGSAGLAASTAAARLGARTLLVERHGSLGGMATAALVHSICGLYRLPVEKDAPPVLANEGFAAEFARRLCEMGGAQGPMRMGRVDVLLHRPAAFARLADRIVRETAGLAVSLHTELVSADAASVTLTCRGVVRKVRAPAWVDATGDGVLATLRGAASEIETSARLQRPAFIFALGNADPALLDDNGRLRLARRIVEAVRAGRLPPGALGTHFRASPQAGEAFVTIDLSGGRDFDPLDAFSLSSLETEGRELAENVVEFLREDDAFSRCYVAAWPSRAGVRESRRVIGRYRLETADVESGAQFDDAVAFAAWPMELRENTQGPKLRFPTGDHPCGVPLRSLQLRGEDALFVAGRCISSSHEAQASLRVIGTCLATGEAAGLAAALKAFQVDNDAAAVRAARTRIAA